MSNRWSYSRITTYEKCPRAYRYKYIDHEKEAFNSIEAFMGTIVHEVIEWLYGEREKGIEHTLAEALRTYDQRWMAAWGLQADVAARPVKVIRDGDTVALNQALGRLTIENFHPQFIEDTFKTLAIEHQVQATLGDKYTFHGYIDRCARDQEGRPWIIDYKTSKNAPEEFRGKEAEQVGAYGLAVLKERPDILSINLRLDFVRAGKILDGVITRADMERVERQLVSRIAAAEVKSYTTRVSRLCDWCGYNDRCDGPKKAKLKGGNVVPF